jgi:3-deoxy-D-manno-octulosonate 8-phosphate phosphatase (KDO 8-P phosphatase)
VLDVDGTMTDGGIYYDASGNEWKKFNTKDAAGIFAARCAGIKTMVLNGRKSFAVENRMKELKVDYMYQGISDKKKFLIDYMKNSGMTKYCAGYIGDDLNDFEPMKVAGLVCCPGDACDEIKQISDYVASANGGYGAVRECITYLLKSRGEWETAIAAAYRFGV